MIMSLLVMSRSAPAATLSDDGRLTDALLPEGWPLPKPGALSRIRTVPALMFTAWFCGSLLTWSVPAPVLVTLLAGAAMVEVTVPVAPAATSNAPTASVPPVRA